MDHTTSTCSTTADSFSIYIVSYWKFGHTSYGYLFPINMLDISILLSSSTNASGTGPIVGSSLDNYTGDRVDPIDSNLSISFQTHSDSMILGPSGGPARIMGTLARVNSLNVAVVSDPTYYK